LSLGQLYLNTTTIRGALRLLSALYGSAHN
jgi:hypothetical protein